MTLNISYMVKDTAFIIMEGNRKPHPGFRMVSVRMTLSDLWSRFQGHDIIQRQITQKRYKIELFYNGGRIWSSNGVIFNDLERPLPQFQAHAVLWRWISQKRYEIQCHFEWPTVILSDSQIFNDTKRRPVSATAELLGAVSHRKAWSPLTMLHYHITTEAGGPTRCH